MTAENPHAGQGVVVLDIGGDVGALVITAPATMADAEIEIGPAGARDHHPPDDGQGWWAGEWRAHAHHHGAPAWPHVAVLPRPTPAGAKHAAVYPGLHAGRYDIWLGPNGPTMLTVTVAGGQVATAAWPESSAASGAGKGA